MSMQKMMMNNVCRFAQLVILTSLVANSGSAQEPTAEQGNPGRAIVSRFGEEARNLAPLVRTRIARQFLAATTMLAPGEPRTIYRHPEYSRYLSAQEAAKMPQELREDLTAHEISAESFYTTKYGTPMAYSRVLELAGQAGLESLVGRKVLDIGYGTIGHLRLMAGMGAEAVGVDVDSYLPALYSDDSDRGAVENPNGTIGRVNMVNGRWPSTETVRAAVGGGYDLITSKNTLKRGYIHPAHEVDKRMTIDLGVEDEMFCAQLYTALNPGGYVVIYNLCPPQNPDDEQYIPWADGRCPFSRDVLETAGFTIIAFDVVDDQPARAMAHALGWDMGSRPMNPETDLFGKYTIVKRPG